MKKNTVFSNWICLRWVPSLPVFLLLLGVIQAQAKSNEDPEAAKIATVDMQRALQTVDAGKKAKQQFEIEFNSKKKELQAEEAAIQKMYEELNKQTLVLSEEAKAKKGAELKERAMKYQERAARSQAEIEMKQQELTKPIIEKLKKIVTQIAPKKGYNLVLEKNENPNAFSGVLFSLEKHDLTQLVIDQFDEK